MKNNSSISPPGPHSRIPWKVFTRLRKDPLLFLTTVARDHGEIASFTTLGRRYIIITSPDLAKEILLTQADAFWKGRALQNSKGILGDGLLTSEGETHKCQRRVMQPAFHSRRVEAYAPDILACTRSLAHEWDKIGETVLDIRSAMMRMTLIIAGHTLFGSMLDDETTLVARSMEALMGNYGRTVVPWGKLLNMLPLPSTLRLNRARHDLMGLVSRMIAARRKDMTAGTAPRHDLLSALLAATDPESQGTRLTDDQVRDQAITILTAGHETTANAMTFTLYLLARHPNEQTALRHEITQTLNGREPTVDDLANLERVRWVLSESMRLLPPAWTLGRESQRPIQLAGYSIPAKTTFLIPQWVMHHDERHFPDPLAFRPDRWKNPTHPRFAYLPFSTGPRNCIGESFAWLEMMLALSLLVSRFRFDLADNQTDLKLVPAITLRPKERVMMRITPLR